MLIIINLYDILSVKSSSFFLFSRYLFFYDRDIFKLFVCIQEIYFCSMAKKLAKKKKKSKKSKNYLFYVQEICKLFV